MPSPGLRCSISDAIAMAPDMAKKPSQGSRKLAEQRRRATATAPQALAPSRGRQDKVLKADAMPAQAR